MTAEERKHRIEAYLQRVEFASLEELSQHVEASVSTVRRDLSVLEAAGELRRRLVWGGTRLDLTDRANAPWWMMVSTDDMTIHALDAVIGRPDWAAAEGRSGLSRVSGRRRPWPSRPRSD